MGPENKVGPENQVGPENRVGPANNFGIPEPSASFGSIRLVKLISTNLFQPHKRLSGDELERKIKILNIW